MSLFSKPKTPSAPAAPTKENVAPKGKPTDETAALLRRTGLKSNIYTSALGVTKPANTGTSQLLGMVGG